MKCNKLFSVKKNFDPRAGADVGTKVCRLVPTLTL